MDDPAMVAEAKRAARLRGLAARAAGNPAAGLLLAGHVLEFLPAPPRAVIAGYWPLAGEIDVRPLMLALAGRGHGLALPVTGPRGTALAFRRFRFGDPMEEGRFGTRHPMPGAAGVVPRLLLVPAVAFDAEGGRIGHGAGYYDRTLAALRAQGPAFALGIAYAAQRQQRLPSDEHDARLDAVATEAGVLVIR